MIGTDRSARHSLRPQTRRCLVISTCANIFLNNLHFPVLLYFTEFSLLFFDRMKFVVAVSLLVCGVSSIQLVAGTVEGKNVFLFYFVQKTRFWFFYHCISTNEPISASFGKKCDTPTSYDSHGRNLFMSICPIIICPLSLNVNSFPNSKFIRSYLDCVHIGTWSMENLWLRLWIIPKCM